MKTHLQAKVEAVNKVNAEINRVAPLFFEAVKPFLGKKVLKVGGLMGTLKKVLPEVKSWNSYPNCSQFTLSYAVREMVGYDSKTEQNCYACYYDSYFSFGDVKDGVLVKVPENHSPLRCDYTVEEVIQKRKDVDEAQDALRKAESALYPFPRYDS